MPLREEIGLPGQTEALSALLLQEDVCPLATESLGATLGAYTMNAGLIQ
jgi:hypothetical protein